MRYNSTFYNIDDSLFYAQNGKSSGGDENNGKNSGGDENSQVSSDVNTSVGTGTSSGGGSNQNDQLGLVNANAQANLNVSIFDSGAAGAGVSLGAGATAALGVLTVAAAAVAVVAGVVSIAQMIDTAQKQANYQDGIKSQQEYLLLLQSELSALGTEYEGKIQLQKEEIAYREKQLAQNKLLLVASMTTIGVASLVFAYGVIKLKK